MMKKSLQIVFGTSLLISLFSPYLVVSTRAQAISKTDPNSITVVTIPTADPLAVSNPALLDPAILQGPTSGGTPTTASTTPTSTNSVPTTPSNPPPVVTPIVPPTTTIPRAPAPETTLPTTTIVTPGNETCPTLPPLSNQNPQCPKVETAPPIIPQFPVALMATPLLAVILFWIIISYLNNGQVRTEKRFVTKKLALAHQQDVDRTRIKEYENLLDLLTKGLSSVDTLHSADYKIISAKIQLLGSSQMQNLVSRIDTAIQASNRQSLKPLIKELGQQIKKEL